MPEAIDVRREMYGSEEFKYSLAERLNYPLDRIKLPLDALRRANVIPSELDDNTEALRVEATKIVLAIASQVRKPEAIPMVVERFGAMTLQAEPGKPRTKWSTDGFFAADLANLLQKYWQLADGSPLDPIPTIGVSLFWGDGKGSVLFATIDGWQRGRPRHQKIYCSEAFRLPAAPGGEWDFIQLPTVGGTTLSPISLVGISELLRAGVEDTAADL
jgi:hypothetical protein